MAIRFDEGVSDADADERDGGAHDEDPRDAVRAHGGDRAEGVGAQQRAQLAEACGASEERGAHRGGEGLRGQHVPATVGERGCNRR